MVHYRQAGEAALLEEAGNVALDEVRSHADLGSLEEDQCLATDQPRVNAYNHSRLACQCFDALHAFLGLDYLVVCLPEGTIVEGSSCRLEVSQGVILEIDEIDTILETYLVLYVRDLL